jgi:copper chaperone CopZ
MNTLTLSINGMSCGHCLNAVRQALESQPGVKVRSVRIGRAELDYDPSRTDPDRISDAITEAGYEAVVV